LLWIKFAPIYSQNTNIEVEKFVDKYLSTNSLLITKELRALQHHCHTKNCRKHRNSNCIFNFPIPPTKVKKILEPLEYDSDKTKAHANLIFKTINSTRNSENDTFDSFLANLGLVNNEYIHAIQCMLNQTTLLLQIKSVDIWTNNFAQHILGIWIANIDSKFVLNSYASAMYCSSYMIKEDKTLIRTFKNIREYHVKTKSEFINTISSLGKYLVNMQQMSAK